MGTLTSLVRSIARFFAVWFIDSLSLLLTALIFSGINFLSGSTGLELLIEGLAAAFLLSIVNLLIRPLVLLLARPLGFIAVFIIGFLVNALTLIITADLLPFFGVNGILDAIIGGLIFAALNVILTGVMEMNDEGSFYQGLIERLARRQSYAHVDEGKRGLIMMEIDGLSFHHIKKAIADGHMPTLERMIEEEDYQLSHVDCGIPSQTSACQAGIMFGDNSDIPAFRWYDKDEQKLYVSGNDATELNSRYANGQGLMRGGTSINNMLNGDADKSLLTLAGMFDAEGEENKRRAEDVYLLLLNPYFLTRTIILFFVDAIREVWQGWQQRRQDIEPRLNRLEHGYPFLRAATTVFMRDISANLAILDIIRGAPSIYLTWPGYDEVAHHSGPWTDDAFKVLATYDSVIAHVHRTIEEKAPRPYDLIILSDHGQSFGKTFKQRYGVSLKEFIEQNLPQGTTVAQSMGGDTGLTSLTAASGELENIQSSGVGGAGGRALAKQGQKFIESNAKKQEAADATEEEVKEAEVVAYGSGNLAQVYFDLYPRKIKLSELETAYPGMLDALIQHEGIGLVCGYEDDGTPVAISATGKRDLYTGEVTGDDPLLPYAPSDPNAIGHAPLETRIWQVRRVMDFPHAGDLMVISTVYPDGTVAALEELIGNHGGLGGEQTDAFLFHPADMEVTPTRNSIDVFHILNNHRDLPAEKPVRASATSAETVNAWSLSNLWQGIADVGTWLPLAARSMFFDRSAYQEIVDNKRMTGPALLIGILTTMLASYMRAEEGSELIHGGGRIAGWLLSVLVVFIAGRLLTHKGNYTRTLRGLGFAHAIYIVELIGFIPQFTAIALLAGTILGFFTSWLGAAEAHETRGWRTFILPVIILAVTILLPLIAVAMVGGIELTLDAILGDIGVQ